MMNKSIWHIFGALVLALAVTVAYGEVAPPMDRDVEVNGPTGLLKGSLREPVGSDAHDLVLIVPGSGPTDRDGNSPLGVRAASYRLLAEGLAANGIASVRIDKRGMYESASAANDANAVTIADYAADVQAWVSGMRKQTGLRCIWVLGHSEGALVAQVAAKDGNGICGLILVAAPGRRMSEVLRTQLEDNPANAPLLPQAMKAIQELEQGRRIDVSRFPEPLRKLFSPSIQGFWISLFSYDPANVLADYKKPALVMQGTNDLQVGIDDAERLAKSCSCARLIKIDSMNHVLKKVATGNTLENMASYSDSSLPLAPEVVPSIVSFIRGK